MDVHLKRGKDRPLKFGHPWVFSGALADLDPQTQPGAPVRVLADDGTVLGHGYANPRCSIAVRMLTFSDVPADPDLLRSRVDGALKLRHAVVPDATDAYRLINGEGDRLPGIVVDRYAGFLVVQCLTAGADRMKDVICEALAERLAPAGIYERSEGAVREAEGLAAAVGPLRGERPGPLTIRQNGLTFIVDPTAGQKTGFFLDQQVNRALARANARGRCVLDAFSYTGGFAVHAGAGGAARVLAVESSAAALAVARQSWESNNLEPARVDFVQADVRRFLRETSERFDLLILDPPALVKQRKDVARGARAYKDLQLWALRRAEFGALLMTFSCSQHVDAELFRKIVLGAAADAKRELQLLRRLGPGPDHPVALGHPEGEYLHGLLLRVS